MRGAAFHACSEARREAGRPVSVAAMPDVAAGDGVAFVVHGDVVLTLWKEPARVARGRWLFDATERGIAERGSFVLIQLILPSSSPPDGPMRAESSVRIKRWGERLRRVVSIPLGDALWISVVRTIMRAMFILQRNATTQVVASDIASGLRLVRDVSSVETPSFEALKSDIAALFVALKVPVPGELEATRDRDA